MALRPPIPDPVRPAQPIHPLHPAAPLRGLCAAGTAGLRRGVRLALRGWGLALLATLALVQPAAAMPGAGLPAEETAAADARAVAALLQARCVLCHAGPQAAAGLRLDSHAALMAGSPRGPVVQPGRPADSELLRRVRGHSLPRMPLDGPPWLAEADVALLDRWIAAGARSGDAAPAAAGAAAAMPVLGPGELPTWRHVAPILAQRCVSCHAAQGRMGPAPEGYRLDSLAGALDPGDRARIVPGRPEASELVRRIRGQAAPRMPLDGPPWLAPAQIELIERWVAGGARDAEGRPAALPVGARLRLHGRLDPDGRLDGLALDLRGARIDKSPGPGDAVQLRARLGPDGGIQVERLRRR